MTAITQKKVKANVKISWFHFVGLALGVVMLLAYLGLPWANQPEMGPTFAQTFSAERSANEIGIQREGLTLIPGAALGAIIIGIWSLLAPHNARTAALLTAIAGIIGLVYYINFFRDAPNNALDVVSLMGPGFWLALIMAIALVLQYALPRPHLKGFEISRTLGNQETVLAMGLVLIIVLVGIANPRFLAERNLSDVLQGNAYIAVAAIGASMVIISGNIDISVGSLIGVLATISGTLAVNGFPIWFSWLAPLFFGALVGAFIGFLVAYLRIPSIIVTLGMLSILKGGLIIVTGGAWITDMPPGYELAQMRPLGIPMPVIFMVVLTILAMVWMRYSATGRAIYAVGGNAEAAHLSGISRRRIIMTVFIINGVFAGIASILFATQLSVIQSTVPPNLELTIITASVVGGVSILGGTGTVIGSTLAAILLNAIRSAMVFINVSAFWLQAVQGLLILITVLADIVRRRRR